MVVGLFCNLSTESERRLYSVSFPLVIKRLLDTIRGLDRSTLHALIYLSAMAVVVCGCVLRLHLCARESVQSFEGVIMADTVEETDNLSLCLRFELPALLRIVDRQPAYPCDFNM
jgi:hypothetical protein